jgi:ParB family chromosome partitioning protein
MIEYDPYKVIHIPMTEIYSDNDFNCRGAINVMDVKSLAEDIQKNDLQFPISVQPACDIVGGLAAGKKYRIIAGHRRFAAFRILKRETIPAMVKCGLSEARALIYNLTENLQRQDLNILQEAMAIDRLKGFGLTQEQVAKEVGRTRSWVQVRFSLLELPQDIQHEAAAGFINQLQIKQLSSLSTKEDQYAAVRAIKDGLMRGKKGLAVGKKPAQDPFKKKKRASNEIFDMIQHIGKEGPGYCFATRALAWANGEVSTAELYLEIREECKKKGKTYVIPVESLERTG